MKKIIFMLATLCIFLAALFVIRNINTQTKTNTAVPNRVNDTNSRQNTDSPFSIVTQNLDTPWAIAILPDNSMLITERAGRVRLVDNQGQLQTQPMAILTKVKEYGEGGLLGVALHPKFSTNNYVYLYYTYSGTGNNTLNRVVRMVYAEGRLKNEQIILDKIPGAIFHNGGRIKFGPDKLLYIVTGDSQQPSLAQDVNSLAGKTLRITDEGKIPSDNPFKNATYSYGHRNSQGLAWDPNGNLWETEHGRSAPTGFDELNLIEKGKNYGWDIIQGDETKNALQTPKKHSGPTDTWAPAGAVFLPADRQRVDNSLFFAGLRGEALYEAVIKDKNVVELKTHFKNQFGRLREVVLGTDGMIYITTSNQDGRGNPQEGDDKIIKIDPTKL